MNDEELFTKYAFLDFEASGLHKGSYPIQVGWALPDLTGGSVYIKHEPWLNDIDLWDPEAQKIHGIPRKVVWDCGKPVAEVVQTLADALQGYTVYVDSPAYDGGWYYMLWDAAGLERAPFPLYDAKQFLPLMAMRLGRTGRYQNAWEIAKRETPRNHDAQADATFWANLARLIRMPLDEYQKTLCIHAR